MAPSSSCTRSLPRPSSLGGAGSGAKAGATEGESEGSAKKRKRKKEEGPVEGSSSKRRREKGQGSLLRPSTGQGVGGGSSETHRSKKSEGEGPAGTRKRRKKREGRRSAEGGEDTDRLGSRSKEDQAGVRSGAVPRPGSSHGQRKRKLLMLNDAEDEDGRRQHADGVGEEEPLDEEDESLAHDRGDEGDDTPAMHPPLQHTTPAGAVLTQKNAGSVFSSYLHALDPNPLNVRTTTTWSVVPPAPRSLDPADAARPSGHSATSDPRGPSEPDSKDHIILARSAQSLSSYDVTAHPTLTSSSNPASAKRKTKPPKSPQAPSQPPPDSTFHCTISLPPVSPIRRASSASLFPASPDGFASKQLARQAAAFQSVLLLMEQGEVDERLVPTPRTSAQRSASARVEPSDKPFDERRARRVLDGSMLPSFGAALDGADEVPLRERWNALKASVAERLPARSPLSPIGPGGMAMYAYVSTPRFWAECPAFDGNDAELFASLLQLRIGGPRGSEEFRVLCLLTTRRLPILWAGHEVDVDIGQGDLGRGKVDAWMRLVDAGRMRRLAEYQLEMAMRWTEGVMRAQLMRPVRCALSSAKWLILPMTRGYAIPARPDNIKRDQHGEEIEIRDRDVAWNELAAVDGELAAPFDVWNPEVFRAQTTDAMVSLKATFSRRSYVSLVRTDLSPSSPDPARQGYTFADPSPSSSSKSSGQLRPTVYPRQPVLQCERAQPAKHTGFITSALPSEPVSPQYLLPEQSLRYFIPASVFRTTSVLPLFLAALDDALIAHEMASSLFPASSLRWDLALQAVTCPMARHNAPEKSYQRLELLGDTILKLVATLDLYLAVGSRGVVEGDKMHQDRHLMVSNRSLMVNAIEAGVAPYVRSQPFRIKGWVPMGWSDDGKHGVGKEEHGRQAAKDEAGEGQMLGDKVLADVAESLIAASYLSSSWPSSANPMDRAIATMLALKIPLKHVQKWGDIAAMDSSINTRRKRSSSGLIITANALDGAQTLNGAQKARSGTGDSSIRTKGVLNGSKGLNGSDGYDGLDMDGSGSPPSPSWMTASQPASTGLLGYEFLDRKKATDVMSLSSDPRRKAIFNKYKMVGDALIDYYVIDKLWHRHPELGPAPITHMKHSRVGDSCLAAFCVASGLLDMLHDVDLQIVPQLKKFKKAIGVAKREADEAMRRGEGGKEYWYEVAQHNYLSDIPEALFGAIFHDCGYDLAVPRQVFTTHLLPFVERYCVGPGEHSSHPKSVFLEMMFGRGCERWEIRKMPEVEGEFGTSVLLHDQELGRACTESPGLATRKACEEAIATIKARGLETICRCPKRKKG